MTGDEHPPGEDAPSKISFKAIDKDGKRIDEVPVDSPGEVQPVVSFKPLGKGSVDTVRELVPKGDDSPLILGVEEVPKKSTCIVCHLPVFEYDKDLFTCPNCGREAHFLCATIFVTEHGICPVCSTRLGRSKDGDGYVVVRK